MTMAVRHSEAGKASHTPVIPNSADKKNAKMIIATKPRRTEVTNAHVAFSVALKNPVPMMLKPANK